MRVDELTSESLYDSFLNSHVLVKREQEFMRVDNREVAREFSQI